MLTHNAAALFSLIAAVLLCIAAVRDRKPLLTSEQTKGRNIMDSFKS